MMLSLMLIARNVEGFSRCRTAVRPLLRMGADGPRGFSSPSYSSSGYSSPGSSSPGSSGAVTDQDQRTYGSYNIYKGRAAVSVKPIAPTFKTLSKASRTVAREGALFFEFAPIGNAPKVYDWTQKIAISLDVTECGALLAMDPAVGLEFSHDPFMGSPEGGQTMKKLKISRAPDGKGMFFNLQVTDKQRGPASFSVLVSWAELEVIKTTARYCIPYFLGFDRMFDSSA